MWIDNYDLFCFDFDGLLVNTEALHCKAYDEMLARRGYVLGWDFFEYCDKAHFSTEVLRDAVYGKLPKLREEEPQWDVLREEKQQIYQGLLTQGSVELMPGAGALLEAIGDRKMCVVTNSTAVQIGRIRQVLPELDCIKHWFTREDYERPKPAPDGYLHALRSLGAERAIGFEDTLKGLNALRETPITAVLVCPKEHPQLSRLPEDTNYFSSLEELLAGDLCQL
ncbi:MAG: HAD family phosphatase [Simkaniaceae bacterium]|nr:HAD family phosphatase [Simkaniaceae bacterium]